MWGTIISLFITFVVANVANTKSGLKASLDIAIME